MKRNFFKTAEAGLAMLEFTFCLPTLLLFSAGVVNICNLFSVNDVVLNAIHYGGSYAIDYSDSESSCNKLITKTNLQIDAYLEKVLTKQQRLQWGEPKTEVFLEEWHGLIQHYVRTSISNTGTTNCILCYDNLFNQFNITVKGTYVLYNPCE